MYVTLHLQIVANSKKNEIVGKVDDRLKVKIKAPAMEGKANRELVKFLSKEFSIPKSEIEIVRGQTSKFKQVRLLSSQALETFLAKLQSSDAE